LHGKSLSLPGGGGPGLKSKARNMVGSTCRERTPEKVFKEGLAKIKKSAKMDPKKAA